MNSEPDSAEAVDEPEQEQRPSEADLDQLMSETEEKLELRNATPTAPIIDIGDNLRLIGTAHISRASAAAVRQEIEEWKPDVVAVELCAPRLAALKDERRMDEEALSKVIKEGKAPLVLFQSLLAAEQRRLGLAEGETPGTDLLAAVNTAEEREVEIELVDRDIQTTLRRAWRRMRLREKWRIIWNLLLGDDEEEEQIEVEQLLQDSDLLTELLQELRELAPGAGEVLLDERDEYLATRIDGLRDRGRVLAVLGAGHLEGVAERLRDPDQLDAQRLLELDELPQPRSFTKVLKYGMPLVILGVFGWLLWNSEWEQLKAALAVYIIANSGLAALGALIARGHPLTILTAAIAAPITSVNPTLAAGWFAGYVQMKVAQPTTKDLQDFLKLDAMNLFWANRVGRVLLVTALANLGSVAGSFISIGYLPALL
jgi:pheromone shutdown-related protein TraB